MLELVDLDRCEHGRHAIDICGGCGRESHGNPHKGVVIGFDVHAKPYTAIELFEEIVKLRVSLHVHHLVRDETCLYCTSVHNNSQIGTDDGV